MEDQLSIASQSELPGTVDKAVLQARKQGLLAEMGDRLQLGIGCG
jgi:hypothetical protein